MITDLPSFLARVDQSGECWIWLGGHGSDGYGALLFHGRAQGAHRVAYQLIVGPIPAGLQIDHLCAVRDCVNPLHLEPVTQVENLRRIGERRTHCPHGHLYDEANTYRTPGRGGRVCRVCRRENWRRRYHERKAAS